MKETVGSVFSIAVNNPSVPGCTISKEISENEQYVAYYSLAKNTDISAEIFYYHKFLIVADGGIGVYYDNKSVACRAGECIITPTDIPVGIKSELGAVYTEILIRRSNFMNHMVNAGEVFSLSELVPYKDGKIVNMDITHNEKMKFVVMAFDAGTGFSEHAAPGEALIFALDGSGVIGYEGKEYLIKAGENFHFAKGGRHYVKATEKFKMALLLTLE